MLLKKLLNFALILKLAAAFKKLGKHMITVGNEFGNAAKQKFKISD